jgi:hypothetical protein
MKWTDKHGIERCDCEASQARIAQLEALLLSIENWLRPEVVKEPDRTFFWKIVELRRKHQGLPPSTAETSSKQPDQYAAHTQDCAIRRPPSRFGEYVCDCPASKQEKGNVHDER